MSKADEVTLSKAIPARILGVPVTIEAGARLIVGPTEMAGGKPIRQLWAPQAARDLAPTFTIAAEHLPEKTIS